MSPGKIPKEKEREKEVKIVTPKKSVRVSLCVYNYLSPVSIPDSTLSVEDHVVGHLDGTLPVRDTPLVFPLYGELPSKTVSCHGGSAIVADLFMNVLHGEVVLRNVYSLWQVSNTSYLVVEERTERPHQSGSYQGRRRRHGSEKSAGDDPRGDPRHLRRTDDL